LRSEKPRGLPRGIRASNFSTKGGSASGGKATSLAATTGDKVKNRRNTLLLAAGIADFREVAL